MPEEDEEIRKLLKDEKKDPEEIDTETLDKIMDRMSERYKKEGILEEQKAPERTKELRSLMRGEQTYELGRASASELEKFDNSLISFFGKLYMALEAPVGKMEKVLGKSIGKKIERDLNAARMDYSSEQYIVISIIATLIAAGSVFAFFAILSLVGFLSFMISIVLALLMVPIVFGIAMILPRSKANKVGNEVEKELPFALRHMSIQIQAGVGVYETMESIATSDYGRLSEGFGWILGNIDKGMSTEDALQSWAEKTRSKSVRRVVSHIVRALRTGGSLSGIMVEIADDVSFERRQKIGEFSEKLNLVGLFLMMSAIVFPILIAILTAIGSTPQIQEHMGLFGAFSVSMLAVVFFIVVPSLLFLFIYYIKVSDPGAV